MTVKQPASSACSLYPKLLRYLDERVTEFAAIPSDRKAELAKVADDAEFEAERYDERSAQICSEMLYRMSLV